MRNNLNISDTNDNRLTNACNTVLERFDKENQTHMYDACDEVLEIFDNANQDNTRNNCDEFLERFDKVNGMVTNRNEKHNTMSMESSDSIVQNKQWYQS